jgi:hypothetical protein
MKSPGLGKRIAKIKAAMAKAAKAEAAMASAFVARFKSLRLQGG